MRSPVVSGWLLRMPLLIPMSPLVLMAGCALGGHQVPPRFDRVADERALREMWADFQRAFNAGDAVAATRWYALDSDRIGADGTKVSGRAAITEKYAGMLARRMADPTRKPFRAAIDVRFVRPDVALLDGSWQGQREGRGVRGFFTLVAERQAEGWRIAAGRDRGVVEQ